MFSSVRGSSTPNPILANPSVQRIIVEPGLPFDATSIAEINAGPRAVCPFASCLFNCFKRESKDTSSGYTSLNPDKLTTIDCLLWSLSHSILTVGVLLSPITVTSLLKEIKPTFL